MSFENHTYYQRKPDPVTAVRLTAQGAIPVGHAGMAWIVRARAEGQLTAGPMGGLFVSGGNGTRAAYGGDWVLRHETDGTMDVLPHERFEALYEPREVEDE